MKIAILTSGILPVPAVQGGAVENLIDSYLEYNEKHAIHDITVYSIWHPSVKSHPAIKSRFNHYVYIKTRTLWAYFQKKLFIKTNQKSYYHYTIEYYLHKSLKKINKSRFDVIIIENRPAYALKLREFTNAKIILHLHNDKLEKGTLQAQDIYNCTDMILTVSNYISNRVGTIKSNDKKCATIYNGIDLMKFNSKNIPAKKLFNPDDFVLVYNGRINKEKGIMQLIDALVKLINYPHIKLLVIGSSFYGNDKNDNSFIKCLKEKATSLKDRIIFTGYIPHSEIPSYLKSAHIAVIPSIWDDPFPTTVLEAQAMGLPIITTRRGGIPEEVTEKNAILLDTNEFFVDNLTKSILELYKDPKRCAEMAKASIERSKIFDKDTYATNFFSIIKKMNLTHK